MWNVEGPRGLAAAVELLAAGGIRGCRRLSAMICIAEEVAEEIAEEFAEKLAVHAHLGQSASFPLLTVPFASCNIPPSNPMQTSWWQPPAG